MWECGRSILREIRFILIISLIISVWYLIRDFIRTVSGQRLRMRP